MPQYGFLIDLSRCTGCNACVVACKQWHQIEPGPIKWMRVYQWEKGNFPDIDLRVLPIMCFHCQRPLCAEACPNKAIFKEEKYGAVLVDPDRCTGQRKCWDACPYGTPQFESDAPGEKMSKCNMCMDRLEQGLHPICVLSCSLRALEFGPLDDLIRKYHDNGNSMDLWHKGHAPCQSACPAGADAQGYINLIADGEPTKALALFRETSAFAGVLGRVCSHPCEIDCLRGRFDDAVPVCSLKRYVADLELERGRKRASPLPVTRKEKVGVIGSGPAGLSCAYDLIRQGYRVTVFEAKPLAGGLMRYGIPEYRLPGEILDNEIGLIREMGVEIRTKSRIEDLDDLFQQGYGALFVATGAWQSTKLNVPGEDAEGIIYAIDLLGDVNSGKAVKTGDRVAVIGGGSVAVDAARSSLRLGAKEVHIVCMESLDLKSKDRMLAQDKEIEDAIEEGVIIHPSLGVTKFLTCENRVIGVETIECISVREEDGTFNPRFRETGLRPPIEVDMVIIAIGQAVDPSMLPRGLERTHSGTLAAHPVTLQTRDPRVFGGGDVVTGPLDIVSAVAAGKEAALSIDRLFRGEDLERERRQPPLSQRKRLEKKSHRPPSRSPELRRTLGEVDLSFKEESALEQAGRCVRCGSLVPSVVIKREDPKRQIIPWDPVRTLELWQKRHPENGEALPEIFPDISAVLEPPDPGIMGRNKLVLKAKNVEELMFYTTDDE
ncbi:MAG: FAD-dependent oxidoreductase [Deltaproteobacteria bacterium]|nr:FAD-dependent oxidoreductase [Deltaproteobacteria bacterium]